MSEASLEELVTGKAPAVVEQAPDTTGEQTPAATTEEKPPEQKAEPKQDAAPPADKKGEAEEPWTKKAALDERAKRQEAERKLAEMEKRLAELQSPTKKPDIFEDPDGVLGSMRQELKSDLLQARIEFSQELMRERFEDYDELESEFKDLAKENPFLLNDPEFLKNPAKYAYNTAKKARDAASLKDVDKAKADLEAKIRKEVEEKVRKEAEETTKKEDSKRSATETPSLTKARAADGSFTEAPKSLAELTRLG